MNEEHKEGKEGNLISFLLFRYLPYWPLFVVLLILSVAAAWVYTLYATPIYQSYTTILIQDEKKGVDETGVAEALDIFSTKKIVENEMEVIQSLKLMNDVVNELNLYGQVFEEGGLNDIPAYQTSPVAILARYPAYLHNTVNPVYFTVKAEKEVVIDGKSYPLDQWVTTPYGELKFIKNTKKISEPSNPLFFKLINPKTVATAFVANMDVEPSTKLSTVVTVSLKDAVPQRAEDILNKLVEDYAKSSLDDKNNLALNTLSFVDDRLRSVEKELDSLERGIQKYRDRKGVVDLSEQSKLYLTNVGDNDRKIADVNMKLAVLDEVEKYVSSKNAGPGIIPSTVGIEDPNLTQLIRNLSDTELEYEKLKKTTGANNPMVTPLEKEIDQIKPQILEIIKNQRNSLLASRNNLSTTSTVYNGMLNSVPRKERELTEISRQQTIKNEVYNFLLQKREQTALSISSNVPDSKVIDKAISTSKPVSPNKPVVFIAAVLFSMIIGIGIVAIKEFLNRKVLFRSEIETFTKLPVVAEISDVKKKESLLVKNSQVSLAAEQFRQLRGAIGLFGKNINSKRLLVTSSIPGEGKSYISTNLAISFALAGKKVVLIDLDIRNPKVSHVMGLTNTPGIVEFLTGTKTAREIINETEYQNLYVIGAGGESENALELILNGKLKELLTSIQDDFDYIVMDTSPIDPVTDAYVFSEYCDKTLLVVRHGYTPKTFVQLFDENNKVKALKNPVIVFNGVRSRGFLKSTYGYGYGYGYANVYRERSRKGSKKKLEI